jgi:hypothetical protein
MIHVGDEIAEDFEHGGGAEGDQGRGGPDPFKTRSQGKFAGGGTDPQRQQRDEDPEPGRRGEPQADSDPDQRVHQVHAIAPRSSLPAIR